jgi:hypothetical protein
MNTCEICKTTYKTKPTLHNHIRDYHSGKKFYFKCSECLKTEVLDKPFWKKYCSYECKIKHKTLQFNLDFFMQWTDNMAYVIGFLAADGNITNNYDNKKFCVSLKLNTKDVHILESISKMINYTGKLCYKSTLDKRTDKIYKSFSLNLYSINLVNRLIEIGIGPCKSLTMNFPNIPIDYIASFIRGYFDGDGYILKKGYGIGLEEL